MDLEGRLHLRYLQQELKEFLRPARVALGPASALSALLLGTLVAINDPQPAVAALGAV